MRRLVVCDFTIANRQSLHNADFSKKQQLPPCAGWARPTRCARQLAWTLRARSTAVSTFPVAPLGSSGTISISFGARNVGIVRLARPEKLNTISAPFYEAMIELQQTEIVGDHDLRAIALLADGRHFSAGIDLNYAKAVIGKPGRSLYGVYHWQQAYRFWSECNLPVVVGIQGACMGTAIELITACDIRIAADNAKFSLREVDVGISTDLGGTTRLTKLIGPGMTKLLAMTCEDIDAQEAARIRLVERVVPLGELDQTTLAYAEKLAAKPPIAVQMCKKCINIATDAGTSVGLLAEEIQGIYTVSTKDKAEAAAAMLEKRPGRYTCE